MRKKITLQQFVSIKKKQIDIFRDEYIAGNKKYGDENYPMEFPEVDWHEQFEMSHDN